MNHTSQYNTPMYALGATKPVPLDFDLVSKTIEEAIAKIKNAKSRKELDNIVSEMLKQLGFKDSAYKSIFKKGAGYVNQEALKEGENENAMLCRNVQLLATAFGQQLETFGVLNNTDENPTLDIFLDKKFENVPIAIAIAKTLDVIAQKNNLPKDVEQKQEPKQAANEAPSDEGLSTAAKIAIFGGGALAIGGAFYFATRNSEKV